MDQYETERLLRAIEHHLAVVVTGTTRNIYGCACGYLTEDAMQVRVHIRDLRAQPMHAKGGV